MADVFTPEKRSEIMSRIRGRDTAPEHRARRLLHALGFRFRLHRKDLPGRPDIVLPRYRAVIFVHGCFWHGHSGCHRATLPSTNADFWTGKIGNNIARDEAASKALNEAGWKVLTLWQCELKCIDTVAERLLDFLRGDPPGG